jgi:hypothetical protein
MIVDALKCENKLDINQDQSFHIISKIFWAIAVFNLK